MSRDSVLAYCPRCQGNAVDVESVLGAGASCASCGWTGRKADLAIQHVEGVDPEAALARFERGIRNYLVSPAGMGLFLLIKKFGFFSDDPEVQLEEIRAYAPAVAQAIKEAILLKRRELYVNRS